MPTSLFGTGTTINANVNGTLVPQSFVGMAGQTVFNVTAFTYVPGTNSLLVFINGQKQQYPRDFAETSSTSFTLVEAVLVGDFVDVIGYPTLTDAGSAALSASLSAPSGSNQVGFVRPESGANPRTVYAKELENLYAEDFSTLQAAVTAAAGKRLFINSTWVITSAITVLSNTEIVFTVTGLVTTATVDINMFIATGQTNIRFYGSGKLQKTGVPGTVTCAAINLISCTNCHVTNLAFDGFQWTGIWLSRSSQCSVRFNTLTNWGGALQDANGICVYQDSTDNVIEGNWVYTGAEHGILIQDPYSTTALTPKRNLIINNFVGQHTGYGIVIYIPAQQAAFTASIGPASVILTVSAITSGALSIGQAIVDATSGLYYGVILSLGTGVGGVGTYNLDTILTVGSSTMVAASTAPTHNKIINNDIKDIQGSFVSNRSSGPGIYAAGIGVGGTLIQGNKVSNCCVQTLNRTLTPGAIGINGLSSTALKVNIVNNIISDCVQGDGINVSSCKAGANILGNIINIPATNAGAGPGGAGLAGSGIRIEASNNINIVNPDIINLGSSTGILVYANGANCADINISDGSVISTAAQALQVLQAGGFNVIDFTNTGTKYKITGNANACMAIANVIGGSLSGVLATSGNTFSALQLATASNFRISGGSRFNTTSPVSVTLSGVCTNSHMDASCYWGATSALMNNASTGFSVTWRASTAPLTGTWAVGDTTEQSVPVVGNPKRWRVTVAGTPGTHVSEGNL